MQVVALASVAEADRAAFFAYALAVAVSGAGLGFVPEVAEAWAYGRPVIADARAPGRRGARARDRRRHRRARGRLGHRR